MTSGKPLEKNLSTLLSNKHKKMRFKAIVLILLIFIFSCGLESTVIADFNESKQDTITGNLIPINDTVPEFVIQYHNIEFDKRLKEGEYYLFRSKEYIEFKIIEKKLFKAGWNWTAFLIKGELQLTENEFAEYDFYGIYKNHKVFTCNFLAQPVEIVTELETFAATENTIIILGKQWDLSGLDDGTKPPKESSILISYP